MEKYTIYVSELQYGFLEVEAENEEEAIEKVYAEYENGNVFWHSSEITDVTIER